MWPSVVQHMHQNVCAFRLRHSGLYHSDYDMLRSTPGSTDAAFLLDGARALILLGDVAAPALFRGPEAVPVSLMTGAHSMGSTAASFSTNGSDARTISSKPSSTKSLVPLFFASFHLEAPVSLPEQMAEFQSHSS